MMRFGDTTTNWRFQPCRLMFCLFGTLSQPSKMESWFSSIMSLSTEDSEAVSISFICSSAVELTFIFCLPVKLLSLRFMISASLFTACCFRIVSFTSFARHLSSSPSSYLSRYSSSCCFLLCCSTSSSSYSLLPSDFFSSASASFSEVTSASFAISSFRCLVGDRLLRDRARERLGVGARIRQLQLVHDVAPLVVQLLQLAHPVLHLVPQLVNGCDLISSTLWRPSRTVRSDRKPLISDLAFSLMRALSGNSRQFLWSIILPYVPTRLSEKKGVSPISISYRKIPTDHQSHSRPYPPFTPWNCSTSGLM
uniref:Transmembrane protein n=1 Tax=Anopheles coluzzii TaxID=1518534 RepID=A0A8W7PRB8_ANOCL